MKRPSSIVVGTLLMGARVVSGLGVIVTVVVNWPEFANAVVIDDRPSGTVDPATAGTVLGVVLGGYGLVLALYLGLAVLVYLGRNWARVVAMGFATASILVGYLDYAFGGAAITLKTSLVSLTIDILVLLALSGQASRAYARGDGLKPKASQAAHGTHG